jgi:glycosyltransferase involved in cell wall biosynthesis
MLSEQSPTLLHVFSTFAVGGPEVRFVRLANALGAAFRHVLIAMDGVHDSSRMIAPHVDITYLSVPVHKGRRLSIANLRTFRRTLAALRPALLLSYNFGAVEWGLANRLFPFCPHLHFEDGFGPDEADGRQIPRRVWFRRMALSGHAKIVVPSHVLHRIVTKVWRFAPERVRYIANGIDVGRYDRDPDVAGFPALAKRAGEVMIGTVGTLRPEKNFGRLIRIFAQLPATLNARLVIVGDGPERVPLEGLARSLAVAERITFLGQLSEPERVLRAFDVFAITSDTEQMPLTLLEAMAARLPIVSTDVGDIRRIVTPENQPDIVALHEEDQLVQHLAALLRDPQRRTILGAANHDIVNRHYSISQMVATYRQLFTEMITGG